MSDIQICEGCGRSYDFDEGEGYDRRWCSYECEAAKIITRLRIRITELENLRTRIEVLETSAQEVIREVEGFDTWRNEKGQRLKDTPAWCKFYVIAKKALKPEGSKG